MTFSCEAAVPLDVAEFKGLKNVSKFVPDEACSIEGDTYCGHALFRASENHR